MAGWWESRRPGSSPEGAQGREGARGAAGARGGSSASAAATHGGWAAAEGAQAAAQRTRRVHLGRGHPVRARAHV